MKKILSALLCFAMLLAFCIPVSATAQESLLYYQETDLGNGKVLIDEVIEHSQARATGKTVTRRSTIKDGDTVIGIIAFQATFHYDGSTVSVASKSVTQTDTYEGWSYVQNSFTSSGGTVVLSAKLTKWIVLNQSFTMSLTCDKDGNISY